MAFQVVWHKVLLLAAVRGQAHREAGPCDILLFLFGNDGLDISCATNGKLSESEDPAISGDKGPVTCFRFRRDDEIFFLFLLCHSGCGISTQSKTSFDLNFDPFTS